MAKLAGTMTTYDSIGNREDLSDAIYDISPTKTPFMTRAGRGKMEAVLSEWQTESLAAADGANAKPEGNEATFAVPAPTVRVGNRSQISDKTLIISGSQEAIRKAGRRSERAHQMLKRSKELKRDMETILLSNQAADDGSDDGIRRLAGLGAWVRTNDNFGTGGGSPAAPNPAPAAARTDGTQRAFAEADLKTVVKDCFTNGAEPTVLMVGPFNKTVVSGFSGIATHTVNLNNGSRRQATIVGAADVYVHDFGHLEVIPNRFQRERDAWLLDFDFVDVIYLRPFKRTPLAKTGDAEKELLNVEYSLKVKNEAALGLVADLLTS